MNHPIVVGEPPGQALQSAVAELDAGLLVLGSAHRGALGRLVVASVADRMLDNAGCAVAIVPRGNVAPRRLPGQRRRRRRRSLRT